MLEIVHNCHISANENMCVLTDSNLQIISRSPGFAQSKMSMFLTVRKYISINFSVHKHLKVTNVIELKSGLADTVRFLRVFMFIKCLIFINAVLN